LRGEIEWIANTPAIETASKPAWSRLGWIAAGIASLAAVALLYCYGHPGGPRPMCRRSCYIHGELM